VWCAVLAHGIVGPIFLQDAMNTDHYFHVLKKKVFPVAPMYGNIFSTGA
jgi:hypothetical protein